MNIIFIIFSREFPKMARPHNSGSAVKDCFTILHNERAKRDMKIMLKVFLNLGNLVILAQKWYVPITLDLLCLFF